MFLIILGVAFIILSFIFNNQSYILCAIVTFLAVFGIFNICCFLSARDCKKFLDTYGKV